MNERVYALLGIVGPLIAYVSIGASMILAPWFSWEKSALSDLGHAVNSEVSPIFNLGLLLAGSLLMIYAIAVFRKYAKYSSIFLFASALSLQLIATFDEVYGFLHFAVSVLFFVSLGFASVTYTIERRSYLTGIAFIVGLASWVPYWIQMHDAGLALPEAISSIMAALWIMDSALRIWLGK